MASTASRPQRAATPILLAKLRLAAPVPAALLLVLVEVVVTRVVPVPVVAPEVGVPLLFVAAAVMLAVPVEEGTV